MGIKVEVIRPETTVSDVEGQSTSIEVVRSQSSPITTNPLQSVVDVVKTIGVIGNAFVSDVEPTEPYEGMVWIEVPA